MGKLRVLSGSEVIVILTEHGFTKVRHRGSHVVMQKKTDRSSFTIPVPDNREIRFGALKSIIRRSGIESKYFESE